MRYKSQAQIDAELDSQFQRNREERLKQALPKREAQLAELEASLAEAQEKLAPLRDTLRAAEDEAYAKHKDRYAVVAAALRGLKPGSSEYNRAFSAVSAENRRYELEAAQIRAELGVENLLKQEETLKHEIWYLKKYFYDV